MFKSDPELSVCTAKKKKTTKKNHRFHNQVNSTFIFSHKNNHFKHRKKKDEEIKKTIIELDCVTQLENKGLA